MNKFLLLYYGPVEDSPALRDASQRWFEGLGDRVVDSGNPFGSCVEVTAGKGRERTADDGRPTGYSIISAEGQQEAQRLVQDCPFATTVLVCEALRM
jgi:hypothetical protein